MNAVDLFAGPGGWDVAARELGIEPVGVELDDAACATRDAARLRTWQGDVSMVDLSASIWRGAGAVDLLIASPPCPSFSTAGKGAGIEDMALIYSLADAIATDPTIDAHSAMPDELWRDTRSRLVVEPLRWALQLQPRFLAWEQVPPVLPFWEYCAQILERKGWRTWVGKVEAERYGVPQTRERAILMADRERAVHPPRPTHQRYVKGEPQRHEVTLEGEILPWVSMAEALGWGADGVLSTGQRSEHAHGFEPYGRSGGDPAPVVMTNSDRWKFRNGNQDNAAVRDEDEPAPTIHFGKAVNDVSWVTERPAPTIVTSRRSKDGILVGRQLPLGEGENVGGHNWRPDDDPAPTLDSKVGKSWNVNAVDWVYDRRQKTGPADNRTPVPPVPSSEPAPTLTAQGLARGRDVWTRKRPSTAVCGDPRISPPGYRGKAEDYDADGNYIGERSMDKAIRVTEEEALILQSFPPDYPVQGTKSQRFLQIGNAVPPLLAHAILKALLAPVLEKTNDLREAA